MESSQPPPSHAKYLRDDDGAQTCEDSHSSLPLEEGWGTSLCLYQGFWFLSSHLNGVLSCQKHLQARPSDILLVSNPKSGTTWLKAILFAVLNRAKNFNSSSQQCHPLLIQNPHELVPFLELKLYRQQENPDLTAFASPRLFATHLPYYLLPRSVRDAKCKQVYLCRNPKDSFVSMWHFVNRLFPSEKGQTPLPECIDMFCRGLSPYGPYWDHVLGYHKASVEMPEKVLFVMYEEMKEDPHVQVRRLADFLGCPFSEEELRDGTIQRILSMCSFENLSALEVNKSGKLWTGTENSWFFRKGEVGDWVNYLNLQCGKLWTGTENSWFFRKGEVGDWVNYLSVEMADRIDQVMEEKLHGSGLKFKYT